jgi:uncharacterized protein
VSDRESILWQRLDLPGHETAMLTKRSDVWELSGVAVFAESQRPCRVEYEIVCDTHWLTQRCTLRGYHGAAPVSLDVVRAPSGDWTVAGMPAESLHGCADVDLGFSPSTNLLPIRRLGLAVGSSAIVRAAWIKFPQITAEVLEQVYTRLSADRYMYESAGGTFRRELVVDERGFIMDYPGFWRAELRGRDEAPI